GDNDFGNNKPSHKSGMKFKDADTSGDFSNGDTPIKNWPINLLNTSNTVLQTKNTDASGNYSFTIPAAGTYRVCEGNPANQTYPNAQTPTPNGQGETIGPFCPGPSYGYQFTVTSGTELSGNDFGNRGAQCPEDPNAVLTASVSNPNSGVPN